MYQFVTIFSLCFSLPSLYLAQGEIRLAGGLNRCQGRLEVDRGNGYSRACNGIIDSNEARVVCRQLGCDPQGAKRSAHSEIYVTTNSESLTVFAFQCTGSEENVFQCRREGSVCLGGDIDHIVGIECGGQDYAYQLMIGLAGSSGALGIISLLILIWLIYYLITKRKLLKTWLYGISAVCVVSLGIILFLTTAILLIVFAPQARGLLLAIATFPVSAVTLGWLVISIYLLIVFVRKSSIQIEKQLQKSHGHDHKI